LSGLVGNKKQSEVTEMIRLFILPLILLLLLPLSGWGEWILNPDQSSDYPLAVMTPDERVIIFTNILAGGGGITPWVLSYHLFDSQPEILFNHFYSDSINAVGAPVQVRIVSDRCYVLTIHTYPERHWEMYAIDFNGETLWHNVMTSESDPDYSEAMQEHMMVASEAGIIIVWDDFSGESAWTGRWYSPDGEAVREIGPYPNPEYSNRFALASRGDGFLLCHLNSATVIGPEQDSSLTADIGYTIISSHQDGEALNILEEQIYDFILLRRFDILALETSWTDTIVTEDEDEWCISGYWSDRSLVFNSQEECYYQRFNQDGLTGPPVHFYNSLSNVQLVVPFGDDGVDWIMQRDSLNNLDCDIFFGYPDSVEWRYQAGIHTNRPFFLLPDSEQLHLIWQDWDGIHLKLLPDELETVLTPQLPISSELQVFPNPFNGSCRMQLQLKQAGEVRIEVHDLLGREMTVWNEQLPAGWQQILWQPELLSGGIYFITATPEGASPRRARALYLP